MKHMYKRTFFVLLAALALNASVSAADAALTANDVYCFSQADLAPAPETTGVIITNVPDPALGAVKLGSRRIQAGDVLTAESISSLIFLPAENTQGTATVSCLSISEEGLGENAEMTLRIGSGKNEAPTAEDSKFETYKNIPGEVRLKAADPEGDTLTVTIVKEPNRGTLDISPEGTVTYTPTENKVGKDFFTYTVTDTAGNTSSEATVRINIKKPSEKETYADMEGNSALLAATWLEEMGIYTGERISGHRLFQPDEAVNRGEFIAMCVALTAQQEDLEAVSSGFADEDDIPTWLSSYVSEAVKCGYISGVPTEDGLMLLSDRQITRGEAAVIVANLLDLTTESTQSVMAEYDAVPTWAAAAVSATLESGIFDATDSQAVLTRADAAQLLYDAYQTAAEAGKANSLLSWAMK